MATREGDRLFINVVTTRRAPLADPSSLAPWAHNLLKHSVVGSDIESIKFTQCIWSVPSHGLSLGLHSSLVGSVVRHLVSPKISLYTVHLRPLSNLHNIDGYRQVVRVKLCNTRAF